MTHDLAIRGGTLIDGGRRAGVPADIGNVAGIVQEIAPTVRGRQEIDASGHLVVPGFIDIHTHYDPQVLWDPELAALRTAWRDLGRRRQLPGSGHRPRQALAAPDPGRQLGQGRGHEQAPTLDAGIVWDFETYPEYLAAVARRGLAINFGGYVGHTAVRLYVMGDASYERAPPTPENRRDEGRRRRPSIPRGALGFSTDRAGFILGYQGRPVPSVVATQDETEALMRVTAEIGQGIVHVAPGEDYLWMFDFQHSLGRTLNWSAILTYPENSTPEYPRLRRWKRSGQARVAWRRRLWAQVTCRLITHSRSRSSTPAPFPIFRPSPRSSERPGPNAAAFMPTKNRRGRVHAELARGDLLTPRWHLIKVAESGTRPELIGRTLDNLAAERGILPFDIMCDIALADNLATRFSVTFANDDEKGVAELLLGDGCIVGLSDAGAHVAQICDAVLPTDFLAHWVRDRGIMSVEAGIHKLTGELGQVLGIDRGRLCVGAPADIVILDLANLAVGPIRRVADMPAGGERLIADAPRGIAHVLVNGVPVCRDGAMLANARPGAIIASRPN